MPAKLGMIVDFKRQTSYIYIEDAEVCRTSPGQYTWHRARENSPAALFPKETVEVRQERQHPYKLLQVHHRELDDALHQSHHSCSTENGGRGTSLRYSSMAAHTTALLSTASYPTLFANVIIKPLIGLIACFISVMPMWGNVVAGMRTVCDCLDILCECMKMLPK